MTAGAVEPDHDERTLLESVPEFLAQFLFHRSLLPLGDAAALSFLNAAVAGSFRNATGNRLN
jgi:hypothetical protein